MCVCVKTNSSEAVDTPHTHTHTACAHNSGICAKVHCCSALTVARSFAFVINTSSVIVLCDCVAYLCCGVDHGGFPCHPYRSSYSMQNPPPICFTAQEYMARTSFRCLWLGPFFCSSLLHKHIIICWVGFASGATGCVVSLFPRNQICLGEQSIWKPNRKHMNKYNIEVLSIKYVLLDTYNCGASQAIE